jgi:hypothetical protein
MNGIKNPVIAGHYHQDANTGIFFERELEFVKAKAYETLYPATKAMQLIPVSTEVPEGATSIIYELFDEIGMCKIIANYAKDIPRVDVKAQEFTSPIKSGGGAFGYSIDDIAAAAFANKPLSQRKANATVRAFNRLVNSLAWNGDPVNNIPGFLSNPNIATGTVVNPGSGTEWVNKTNLEILHDLNVAVAGVVSATAGEMPPNTILLPIEQHALIATKQMSVDNDRTILQFFLANNPWITKVESLWELDAANNSVFSTDAFVVYNQNAEFLTLEIPKMFKFEPIERRGLEFIINGHGRIGGVIIYQPLSISIYDGI